MTAFKKYAIKKGFECEEQLPCLPFQRGGITIEEIRFFPETAMIRTVYNVGVSYATIHRDGTVTDVFR